MREGLTRKPDSAQAKVVRLKNVPELAGKKVKEILAWAKSILQSGGDITIRSTGQVARFTTTNINASLKRSREKLHNEAYVVLREMVENAEYDHFEPGDVKHATRAIGQDVYYSALSIDEQLYSVRLKMDVVPEEIRQREKAAGMSPENIRYKDHKLTEIEIAPALYHGMPNNGVPMQEAGAISTVSLGVLRGNVKPSNLEGGALWQEQLRGSVEFRGDKSLITLFKAADQSTFVHEMGHVMLENLLRLGRGDDAPPMVARDLDVALDFLNMKDFDFDRVETPAQRKRLIDAQERFARAFERYLMEGRAPIGSSSEPMQWMPICSRCPNPSGRRWGRLWGYTKFPRRNICSTRRTLKKPQGSTGGSTTPWPWTCAQEHWVLRRGTLRGALELKD